MSKLIVVSEIAYEKLNKLKEREKAKSFTAVIMELLQEKEADISDLFGAWKMDDKTAETLKKKLKKEREELFGKA
ncbi:MAG: hypothetical protein BK997_00290 [Candidatus Micrarchaeum sp. ARMAN-1]|jgi:predicted CopG family antitoxin|nr:MAG: hypothetical protein BK997_00290 [Candidatus Micrarchaeum sp. ARMAN-1]